MKKTILIATSLLVAFSTLASAKGNTGGVVVVGAAIGASTRNGAIANASLQEADCAACHVEIYPFKHPDNCFPGIGTDCWIKTDLSDEVTVMTRPDMKIKKLYRYALRYRPYRYFLPAAEGTRNPHFVLEEKE